MMKRAIQNELQDMLEKGVLESSSYAWVSPVVLVKMNDGSQMFCIDYREFNQITIKNAYTFPLIEDNLLY